MLNRHPGIAICRATDYYHYVYLRRRSFVDLSDAGNPRRLVKKYPSLQRIQRMKIDLEALEPILLREGVSYPAFFACLCRYYAEVHGKRRCGEKNARHGMFTVEWAVGSSMKAFEYEPAGRAPSAAIARSLASGALDALRRRVSRALVLRPAIQAACRRRDGQGALP
jgi:hypothetical protein